MYRHDTTVWKACTSTINNNTASKFLFQRWKHLLDDLNQPWLSPTNLEVFVTTIREKGGALQNCWGFIDGTVRPVCRPGHNQRVLYNGHKKVHSVEGRRHDSGMLAMSQLLGKLQLHSYDRFGNIMCIYGDPAYPLRP